MRVRPEGRNSRKQKKKKKRSRDDWLRRGYAAQRGEQLLSLVQHQGSAAPHRSTAQMYERSMDLMIPRLRGGRVELPGKLQEPLCLESRLVDSVKIRLAGSDHRLPYDPNHFGLRPPPREGHSLVKLDHDNRHLLQQLAQP